MKSKRLQKKKQPFFSIKRMMVLILLIGSVQTFSQKLEKIKGSKNVILSEVLLDSINSIELYKDIKLTLRSGNENKLIIHADDNLHEVINIDINEGKLSLSLLYRIRSKKEFELTLQLSNLEEIILNNNSELTNLNYFKSDELHIILNDKSEANLLFDSNSIVFEGNDSSKAEVSFKAKSINYKMLGKSKIKGISNTELVKFTAQDRAVITLMGKSESMFINASESSKVKLISFISDIAEVNAEEKSDVYLNVKEDIVISAVDDSKVYIYGNAEIDLKEFEDKASLYKKE